MSYGIIGPFALCGYRVGLLATHTVITVIPATTKWMIFFTFERKPEHKVPCIERFRSSVFYNVIYGMYYLVALFQFHVTDKSFWNLRVQLFRNPGLLRIFRSSKSLDNYIYIFCSVNTDWLSFISSSVCFNESLISNMSTSNNNN